MPYKWTNEKIKLGRYDRRRKLTQDQKDHIKTLHREGMTTRAIARLYADTCSRRAIQFLIFPERLARARALHRERRKDGRYYDPKKHTEAVRNWRRYKQELYKENKL